MKSDPDDGEDLSLKIATVFALSSQSLDRSAAARRKAEAKRRAAERKRTARFHQWTQARSLLRQAVTAIDAELAPRGYYLSMADDSVHPHDLAAVEIQLFLHGNPCDTLLDITVSSDGRQLARDLGGKGKHLHIKLPPIGRATLSTYSTALLAYIEQAIVQFGERSEEQCRICGSTLRGCHVER